jgi:hypothetical protein
VVDADERRILKVKVKARDQGRTTDGAPHTQRGDEGRG